LDRVPWKEAMIKTLDGPVASTFFCPTLCDYRCKGTSRGEVNKRKKAGIGFQRQLFPTAIEVLRNVASNQVELRKN